ncbi:hypothetical protein UT300007_28580 [Clostridium sp. CTA-7]
MYMKKLNNYTNWGLLFYVIFLLSNCFNLFPEFIKGLGVGLGFTLIFIGIYSKKHDMSKLRNYKKMLLRRVLSK